MKILFCLCVLLLPSLAFADEPAPSVCVDALEQVAALNIFQPAYKASGPDSRHYLKDADRPAEIKRLQKVADASCSTDKKARAVQVADAQRLLGLRSPGCAYLRDTLLLMEKPGSRDPPEDVAERRKLVAKECPSVPSEGAWLLAPVDVN